MKNVKKDRETFLNFVGIIYIVIGILAFFNAFYYYTFSNIFWLCYLGILLIGVGILTKNTTLIMSQIYILFIPDVIWSIDFLSYVFRDGNSFFGIVDYFFQSAPFLAKMVTTQHLLTVPVALFLSYKFSVKSKKGLIAGFLQLNLFFFLSRLFTSLEDNVNCVYKFCGDYGFGVGEFWYILIWFLGGFLMIFLSYFFLNSLHGIWKNVKKDL